MNKISRNLIFGLINWHLQIICEGWKDHKIYSIFDMYKAYHKNICNSFINISYSNK